ncbi:MAG: tail fiber domain-containing protein [Ferruginibacter sp.]
MKTVKLYTALIGFTSLLFISNADAQIVLPATSATSANNNAGIGNTNTSPLTPLDVQTKSATFTQQVWGYTLRLLPLQPNANQVYGSSLIFDRGLDSNLNHYFFAGPSGNPKGNYYTGLTRNLSTTSAVNYVSGVYAVASGSIPEGTTQFYHNVLINGLTGYPRARVGIGTLNPTAQLHTTDSIRFQNLTTSAAAVNTIVSDALGNVFIRPGLPATLANCATNIVPKFSGANALGCSQIYDDGTSVGIGPLYNVAGANFTYNWTSSSAWHNGATGFNLSTTGKVRLAADGVAEAHAFFSTSDGRLKANVKDLVNAVDQIKQLRGVSYVWSKEAIEKRNFDAMPQLGFIAQEVEKIVPEAVIKNADGYYAMNYSAIIPLLNEGIKEQQIQIEKLQSEINELKNKLNQLVPGANKIKVSTFDIIPNPITGTSVISYKLDENNMAAALVIYDLQGKLLKQINISKNVKEGSVQVSKNELAPGMYVIALVSGNTEIQSKKVIVSQ